MFVFVIIITLSFLLLPKKINGLFRLYTWGHYCGGIHHRGHHSLRIFMMEESIGRTYV